MNLLTTDLYKGLNRNNSNLITFAASPKEKIKKTAGVKTEEQKPSIDFESKDMQIIVDGAKKAGVSLTEFIINKCATRVEAEKSVKTSVGRTEITTLIDGGQIFPKALEMVKSAQKSVQLEMFEFQNEDDVDRHPLGGAEAVPGSEEQQQLYDAIIEKNREFKEKNDGSRVQVILDASKWPGDANGKGDKFYNNLKMLKRLLDEDVDVVIYPRSSQGGTKIQHVKLLAVDGEKVMIGGENWGNHSPVNHDACVLIETKDEFKGQGSEVDNIIDVLFNKDWKFACKMIGLCGAMKEEEKHPNLKLIKDEVLPEAKEFMEVVGKLLDNPEYQKKLTKGEFYLPEVKPIENPAIKVLVNSPSEYFEHEIYPEEWDNESIRTYLIGKTDENGQEIKGKLDDPNTNYLRAELFVLSHKEIVDKVIQRHQEGSLDAKILVSPDLLEKFPLLNEPYDQLREAGVPIETFKVNEELNQRLHCKWAVLGHKDGDKLSNLDLLIGSANWSAAGLENNSYTGIRDDYPSNDTNIMDEIEISYKTDVEKSENEVKNDHKIYLGHELKSIFTPREKEEGEEKVLDPKTLFLNLKDNRKILKDREKALFEGQADYGEDHEEALEKIRNLQGHYELVADSLKQLAKYKRGNHEGAVVISNDETANTFVRQFNKDWAFTKVQKTPVSFTGNKRFQNTLYLPIKPNLPVKLESPGRMLNKVV